MQNHHNTRRQFLKGLGALSASTLIPVSAFGANVLNPNSISFDNSVFEQNNAQTIILYLYGGASELAGNLTNLEEINAKSQNPYPLDSITVTKNHFWQEAGGDVMERLLNNKDINIYRTCYRTVDGHRDHGTCTTQAQCGTAKFQQGIATTLASVLDYNNALSMDANNPKSLMPFISLDGNSKFYLNDGLDIPNSFKPVTLDPRNNPYTLSGGNERYVLDPSKPQTTSEYLENLAKRYNVDGVFKSYFERRRILDDYIKEIQEIQPPSGIEYPNTRFGTLIKNAVTIMLDNPYTKLLTMGTPGLGGWDDHSQALANYPRKMSDLFEALEVAIEHIKNSGKTNINIVIFSEFGRNVNYNNAKGWDHGNNQNVYWLGGWDYFNHQAIVGETKLTGNAPRIYTKPTNDSYHFQIFSVASTLFKLYGITNPEVITRNQEIKNLIA